MGIFARRNVQNALDRLSETLSVKDLGHLVNSLNERTFKALATEWEIMMMDALSPLGTLEHERNCGGTRLLDIVFSGAGELNVEFAADVRTVSDANLEDENPIEPLRKETYRLARKVGLSGAGLDLRVESEEVGPYGDRKERLMLPTKSEIPDFVRAQILPFLRQIKAEPDRDRDMQCVQPGVQLRLRYNSQEKEGSSAGWTDYSVPYSPDRNPLYHALKAKADQLRGSGWQGLRGIIICDGGCSALKERSRINNAFGCREITDHFFERHKRTVTFILVIEIVERHQSFGAPPQILLEPKLFWNPRHFPTDKDRIAKVFTAMMHRLPPPMMTPRNALNRLAGKNSNIGDSFYGGCKMKGNEIKISARTLVELLAGTLDQKRFLEDHGAIVSGFFNRQILNGNTIDSVNLEQCEGKDDDWIILKFDGPDAAISPFHLPKGRKGVHSK
jgi:hypothetical protein